MPGRSATSDLTRALTSNLTINLTIDLTRHSTSGVDRETMRRSLRWVHSGVDPPLVKCLVKWMVKYHRFDQTCSLCWMHQKSDESPRPQIPQYHAFAAISRNIVLSPQYRTILCLSPQYRAMSAISFSRRNILI